MCLGYFTHFLSSYTYYCVFTHSYDAFSEKLQSNKIKSMFRHLVGSV